MKFINNGNSFLLSAPASIFAAEIKNELKRHTMFNGEKKQIIQSKRLADALFILWAGGAALLSYSLVYALPSRLRLRASTGSTSSGWITRRQPASCRFPAILFPS